MAPCGPVVSVAGDLWELWERARAEDATAFETLTRYEDLAVSFVGPDEVRAKLEPLQNLLFVTRAPLADEVYLKLDRRPRARVTVTACKIDRNLQVGHLTTVRFARRSARHGPVQRRLRGVGGHLLSVYLVNLGSTRFDFGLSLRPAEARF